MHHNVLLTRWLSYARNRGLYQRDLSEKTGLQQSHISKIKRGERNPEPGTIRKLADGFGVSLEEYLAGPPGTNSDHTSDEYSYIPRYDVSVSAGGGMHIDHEEIKSICAFRTEWIHSAIHSQPSDLFLVDVSGDSMEPNLSDGDIVLVNKSMTALNKDGMYVFRFNGTLLVKRLKMHINGKLEISSDNESYPKLTIDSNELEDITVLGRVLWYGRTVY